MNEQEQNPSTPTPEQLDQDMHKLLYGTDPLIPTPDKTSKAVTNPPKPQPAKSEEQEVHDLLYGTEPVPTDEELNRAIFG